ncbi:alpha/beta fold hydrolase [Actinacidiphila sp. bgisy145]|uniref:alpha/beta fold hydrolase n=1 Tax=Actinacidiphila sp. bgisy145 TaxID=3413792 RepID=UPI003EBE5F2C
MAGNTAFVLVPGLHTGGWIWQDVAERLRAAGAEAVALTLSGVGGETGPEGAGLEAHIADVLRAVERADARRVVLVGHCYGVHPVVGAADRRPDRVARVVLVDTPMPRDGDPPAALVPPHALRTELLRRCADEAEGVRTHGDVAPPSREGWREYGSLHGLGEAGAERLAGRAVPQPWAALAQPLRLAGAAGAAGTVPTTGVLCTANGASLAMVEQALALGDPSLGYLGAPHLTYLEMATGHWPMLSAPGATAEVLLRAAAGEGTAARGPSAERRPGYLRPFVVDVPARPRERTGRVDFHLPDGDGPCPAVVFVHGGPVPAGARPTPRDWPGLAGHARLVARLGAVGVVVDHRLHDLAGFRTAAQDVRDAVARARSHPRVDGGRVALWFLSVGGLLAADWLAEPADWLRCVALSYPVLAPLPGWGVEPRFRPARAVRGAGGLPVVLSRVGRERPEFAATVEEFLLAAREAGVGVQVVDAPSAEHGFDTGEATDEARHAVTTAARAVLSHLAAPGRG